MLLRLCKFPQCGINKSILFLQPVPLPADANGRLLRAAAADVVGVAACLQQPASALLTRLLLLHHPVWTLGCSAPTDRPANWLVDGLAAA